VSLIIGDNLKCEDVEKVVPGFECWSGMKLETLINDERAIYNAIALQPRECCHLNVKEGWRECDPICIFRNLLSRDLVKELEPTLTKDVIVALVSPYPILPPHGVTPITHAPECLLHILVNASRAKEAIHILQYLLAPLFAALIVAPITQQIMQQKFSILPEQTYIDAVLADKVREIINNAPKLRVGGLEFLGIDLKQSYDKCLSYFKELCMKEDDERCLEELRSIKLFV
jgi:hypothetical protein